MSQNNNANTTEQLEQWAKAAAKSAPNGDLNALTWHTPDGIAVKPLYTVADVADLPNTNSLPGFAPFVRGPQASMYAVRPWTIRQYAGFSTAEYLQMIEACLENGITAFDHADIYGHAIKSEQGKHDFQVEIGVNTKKKHL